MGTNYFWINNREDLNETDPRIHVGKRSAAGVYCWDCGTTLCQDGTRYVHHDKGPFGQPVAWLQQCPICEKEAHKKENFSNAASAELGFKKLKREKLSGISSCSSFNWTLMSHKWKLQSLLFSEEQVIVDEYGHRFTAKEFLEDELALVAFEFQYCGVFS